MTTKTQINLTEEINTESANDSTLMSMDEWETALDNVGPAAKIVDYQALLSSCPDNKSEIYHWLDGFVQGLNTAELEVGAEDDIDFLGTRCA